MSLTIGKTNELNVIRETDFSYVLSDGEEEVFLHKKQATKKLELNETVPVFLYIDNKKRTTATMATPYVTIDQAAFVKVVDVSFRLGAFLDIGLIKDLLLSKDDMPFRKAEWPQVGDRILCKMKVSRNQMTARKIARHEVRKYMKPETELIVGERYTGYVIYIADEGIMFSTIEGHLIFVYHKHLRKDYRLGEKAYVKIEIVKPNNHYNGTLIEQKEVMLNEDALRIKEYLEKHEGEMPYTDKSNPEDIRDVFHMSKAAFKRALGVLYKEKLVKLHAEKTILTKKVE